MQTKRKVLILFGGQSGEHEVSIVSAISVFKALDRTKYEPFLVGIDKAGRWLLPNESLLLAQSSNPKLVTLNQTKDLVSLVGDERGGRLVPISEDSGGSQAGANIARRFDVVLPILHGPNGEDGTIQGLLQLSHLPYVGSGVLGSALCMDKEVSKRLLRDAGLPIVPFLAVTRFQFDRSPEEFAEQAAKRFGFPFFVKPANMGSSVGVSKVKVAAEAVEKMREAFQHDSKILIEKSVEARELECAVLGNDEPRASIVGEIVPNAEFYSYDAKYVDENGADLFIPAKNLTEAQQTEVQRLALLAFQSLECAGMARVDFFLDKKSGELYVNELNTIPGFTPNSMYPKLWEASGLPYAQLLDRLIELALEKFKSRA